MEKVLKLYNSRGAFPNADNQIEVLSFNYDAKRMGGAPTIAATIMYGSCLDNVWSDDVYVEFNGEKYYLKQTPTSSFSNADARYRHECEFVSERIKLDNVFFFDAVIGKPEEYDKPVSNSSVFSFFGNIREFAKRLNASLQYSKLQTKNDDGTYSGYVVIVNNDVDDEEKLLSFSNAPFSTALQESYKQFEIPYYFVGKEIHFGYWQNDIKEAFRYGADKELLSIIKTNANQKVVTRCTGTGGTENIPYYYPNAHPQGELTAIYKKAGETTSGALNIVDEALFAKQVLLTDVIERYSYKVKEIPINTTYYKKYDYDKWAKEQGRKASWLNDGKAWFCTPNNKYDKSVAEKYSISAMGAYINYDDSTEALSINDANEEIAIRISCNWDEYKGLPIKIKVNHQFDYAINSQLNEVTLNTSFIGSKRTAAAGKEEDGSFVLTINDISVVLSQCPEWDKSIYLIFNRKYADTFHVDIDFELVTPITKTVWKRSRDGAYVNLKDLGLSDVASPSIGDTVSFKQVGYVQPMPNLMPPIYWESEGEERFYNAINNIYTNPDNGALYTFTNPYSDSKRVEHIVEFPDIKPTIEGMTNNAGQPINAFLEFAYDKEDNDAVDKDGNYVHPYFYAKLPKFDSFNLFTYKNEKGEVTFSMKSGNCGACNFVLGINAESGKNDLQVDDEGKLLFENGVAKRGAPQDRQNDTKNNEVWVALKKDNSTFGTIMPSAQHKYYPKPCTKNTDGSYNADGDTFVLLNITMSIEYVKAAENRLKEEIIRYMHDNNNEKFSFSIKFSRIYLAENPQTLNTLNENAFITVEYNGVKHHLYVNSFAYKMSAGEALPEITVELAETLSASMNAIQAAVSQVKTDVLDRVQKMDIAAMVAANFLSKNDEDYAKQKITFKRGISVGTQDSEVAKIDQTGHADIESATLKKYISSPVFRDGFSGEGFKMWLDENGLSHLTVDTITARQRMTIFEMLIEKSRSVNGGLWVSAANGQIANVVENDDVYEIYFEDYNSFVVGDYMRCQVFTGDNIKHYWVEVANTDKGVAIIKKSEFEEYGTLPQIGDNVFLCGSKNTDRQNAIHISATEDNQPRISIYNGINQKSFKGCLRTQLGSLDNIEDEYFGKGVVKGDGLYSDNAYLKGEFILKKTGQNVETKFEVTDGNIKTAVGSMQEDMEHGGTILFNPSFTMGENGWITENVVTYYLLNGEPIFNGDSLVVNNPYDHAEADYNHRFILNIKDGYIKQLNEYFVNKPNIEENLFVPLTFKVRIMAEEDGNLIVYMDGCTLKSSRAANTPSAVDYSKVNAFKGKANIPSGVDVSTVDVKLGDGRYLSFSVVVSSIGYNDDLLVVIDDNISLFNLTKKQKIEFTSVKEESSLAAYDTLDEPIFFLGYKELVAKEEYLNLEFTTTWNGTGNFNLCFTGGASIYSLQLYSEATEIRHATLFEQTDKLINIAAKNFNANGTISKSSEIVTTASMNAMFSEKFNDDGSLKSTAGLVTSTDLEDMDLVDNVNLQEQLEKYVETEAFAGLFAKAVDDNNVVVESQIEAFVKKDKDGNLESGVNIVADQINLNGYATINDAFSIDEEGRMHAKSGTFSGTVNATDGIFNGSIALRFQQLPIGDKVSLSFDTGFNFAGAESSNGVMYQKTIILPSDSSVLNGVKCTIQNTGIGQTVSGEHIVPYKRFVIKTSNGLPFLHNAMNPYYESNIDTVWIEPARMTTFSASIVGGAVRWTIENGEGLSPIQDAPNILRGAGMQQPFVFWAGEISSKADAAGFYDSPYSFFGASSGVVVSRTAGYDNRFDITFTIPMSDEWVYIPQITSLDTDDRAYIQDITNNGFVLRTGGKVLLTILLLRTAAY